MAWTENDVLEALRLMRPRARPFDLVRVGGEYDGAYLVPDDLEGVVACFSPGVNNLKSFEDELAVRFGMRSHLCDFSSDVASFGTPLIEGMQTFEKKWLEPDGAPDCISLDEWVASREPSGDLLLQMDIEGAEFRNILGASRETLRRFRVIVIEVHSIQATAHVEWYGDHVLAMMRRLDEDFVCVHAHPNNCCGEVVHAASGMNLPGAIELTYLRRDRFVGFPAERWAYPSFPHPADILRNVPEYAPLFLNGAWSDHLQSTESRAKFHEDRLDFLRFESRRLERAIVDEQAALRTARATATGR